MPTDQSTETQARFDTLIGLAIAVVTVTAAVVLWQAARLESQASDLDRQGMIETIKREAAGAETVRFLYQEATYGVLYDVAHARVVRALESVRTSRDQGDEEGVTEGSARAQWLGEAASGLASFSPLTTDEGYRSADGRFDLDKRFVDLKKQDTDLWNLDPPQTFAQADALHKRAKRTTGTVVIFALALFFFTLGQVIDNLLRYLFALIGVGLYGLGLVAAAIIALV